MCWRDTTVVFGVAVWSPRRSCVVLWTSGRMGVWACGIGVLAHGPAVCGLWAMACGPWAICGVWAYSRLAYLGVVVLILPY